MTKGEGKILSSPQVQPPPPPTNQPQEERKGTHTNKHYKERERKGHLLYLYQGGGISSKKRISIGWNISQLTYPSLSKTFHFDIDIY